MRTSNLALDELRSRLVPPEPEAPQVAALNMLPAGIGEALAALSRARKALPEAVEGYGALPAGDVINMAHYTDRKLGELDPAKWGSRAPGMVERQNLEAGWTAQNPDVFSSQAYLPDYGYTKEPMVGNQKIEGYVPGMYNATEDPAGIAKFVRDRRKWQTEGASMQEGPGEKANRFKEEFEREVAQRGYTGSYTPTGASQGGVAMFHDIVDLEGKAPNIAEMRKSLGLVNAPGNAPEAFPVGSVAGVTAESMPGSGVVPDLYKGYEGDPAAGHLLHRDYERLLRNPDGSSVVAQRLGIDANTVQGQGYFKGQSNPLSVQRVAVTPPQVDRLAPLEMIQQQRQLAPGDQAKLTAQALAEGKLRQQDAVAWSYPVAMVDEANLATAGLPKEAITAAVIRGKSMEPKDLKTVTKYLEQVNVPQQAQWTPGGPPEKLTDHLAVVPAPDGGPGIFIFSTNDKLVGDDLMSVVNAVRAREERIWRNTGSTDFNVQWGTHDSGYIPADPVSGYDDAIAGLPDGLREKTQKTIQELEPYVEKVRGYHHELRNGRKATQPR